MKNLTNQRFTRLIALYPTKERKRGAVVWHCKCDCGNECNIPSNCLTSGNVKSCGCLRREVGLKNLKKAQETLTKNLTGLRFGKLIALEYHPGTRKHCATWKCQCDCGNIVYIRTQSLTEGLSLSCGCSMSKGERAIIKILYEQEINFIYQKTYPDLKSDKNYFLRFDFYLPEYNCIIEYQGQQHYLTDDKFNESNKRYKIKKQYCQNNNIKLIEIPYYDYNKLNWNYLEELLNENRVIKN